MNTIKQCKPFSVVFFLSVIAMMIPIVASAQLSQFESAVEAEANSFRTIVATIMDVIFALGAVGVIYAYVTKRQDARDYLIYYAIGIIVYGIIRQTYLTASN
jgi:ABC-type polysaccharide/polyol phosphate export permease